MFTNSLKQYQKVSLLCSKAVTSSYSTSFFSAINMLHPQLHNPIYSIYGFVRLADEIVDTFHDYDKATLLSQFKEETYSSFARGISLNPVLNSFQQVVKDYNIDFTLVEAFFTSMEADLHKEIYYNANELQEYIYGSAEVVGLMCLYVFCEGKKEKFEQLRPAARALGSAFQKVNFLRDLREDYEGLHRTYFPGIEFSNFDEQAKMNIEKDIEKDFQDAYQGILLLPIKAKFGVYVAYKYYLSLFKKIKRLQPAHVMERRVRIPNLNKAALLLGCHIQNQFNLIK